MATKKKSAAKKSTAKKATATAPTVKEDEVVIRESATATDTPDLGNPNGETEEAARKKSDEPECLNKRPNGRTCLEEMQHARENPRFYSAPQQQQIAEGRNLCAVCLEKE